MWILDRLKSFPPLPLDMPILLSKIFPFLMRRWLEFVLNYANYHLPQHIRGQVPFYHAQAATESIRQKLGPYLTEANLNGKLVRNLIEKWQVYDEEKQTYVSFQQALREIEKSEGSEVLSQSGSVASA